MTSASFFHGNHVHHAPVPRKLSDRATLTWGIIWTIVAVATIGVAWSLGDMRWDPLWIVVTATGIALSATLGGAVSRLDATLIFSISPASLIVLYMGTDLGTAIALWGIANVPALFVRVRLIWDVMEYLCYQVGSAFVALSAVEWLAGEYGWREYYTAVALVIYLVTRLIISTVRLSVVTPITVRQGLAALIPIRLALTIFGIPLLAVVSRYLQVYIAERSNAFGPYWAGTYVTLATGLIAFVLATMWTIRVINNQLTGVHDAAISLPWSEDRPISDSALQYVKRALPNYEIEFRDEAGRNINEISSPMANGHLIARRGNNQAPLLEADQLVLDSIAHIGDTMVTVRSDHEKLYRQARTDTITKLPNYRAFMNGLEVTAQEATRGFAVVYIDLDGFKEVNDRYGHEAGNIFLKTVGERLRNQLEADEFVARLGGDEFGLILLRLKDKQAGHERMKVILPAVADHVKVGSLWIPVKLSYGLSFSLPGTTEARHLIEEADYRMYEGRKGRRNGNDRSELMEIGSIRQVIKQASLPFAYQPIIDAETGKIVSLEALIRPGVSELAGSTAEQIAERARFEGQLTELSIYLLRTSLADMRRFQQVVPELNSLHINIDVEQIADDEFIGALQSEWEGAGIELTLELVENSLGKRYDRVTTRLQRMIETPFLHVALDNFGTSGCTLESVIHFPFDTLKIDRSISADLGTNKSDTVIDMIVELGQATGAAVIFEGVENDDVYKYLRASGVRFMQGYRFAKPLLADELVDRFVKHGLDAVVDEPVSEASK